MDLNRLRGEIVATYGSQSAFAQHISWHKNKVSRLLNGQYKPDTDDVAIFVEALNLTPEKFVDIFLPKISPNGDK